MQELVQKKELLEKDLKNAKHNSNEHDLQRLAELEAQIQVLNGQIANTRGLINEKDLLVEEKNRTIEQLTSQNKNSSFSYEIFQKKSDEMAGTLACLNLIKRQSTGIGDIAGRSASRKPAFISGGHAAPNLNHFERRNDRESARGNQ